MNAHCAKSCNVINSQSEKYELMGAHTCSELYDDDNFSGDDGGGGGDKR